MSTAPNPDNAAAAAALRSDNRRIFGKLVVVTALMFGFGYALVPIYKTICTALGINVLSLAELDVQGGARADPKSAAKNTQIDTSRTITIEFDATVTEEMRQVPVANHRLRLVNATVEQALDALTSIHGLTYTITGPKAVRISKKV